MICQMNILVCTPGRLLQHMDQVTTANRLRKPPALLLLSSGLCLLPALSYASICCPLSVAFVSLPSVSAFAAPAAEKRERREETGEERRQEKGGGREESGREEERGGVP